MTQKITKVHLNDNGGTKGATIQSIVPEEKDGVTFMNSRKDDNHRPVHIGLLKRFKDLRIHLLELSDMTIGDISAADKRTMIEDTYVTVIENTGDGFRLAGYKEVRDGKFMLNPPNSVEDNYDNHGGIAAIWDSLLEETAKYMSGEVKVSDEEVVQRMVELGKVKGMTPDAYEAMEDDEKKEFLRNQIEKLFGGMVIMPEDVESPVLAVDSEEVPVTNEMAVPVIEFEVGKTAEVVEIPAKQV